MVLALTSVACGSESADVGAQNPDQSAASSTPTGSGTASDPASSPHGDAGESGDSGGALAFDEVALLHGSAAGGATSTRPTVLDSDAAVEDLVAQFTGGNLADDVRNTVAATTVPKAKTLVGAVVAIGCDVPPGVTVREADGLVITPKKVVSPLKECLVAVTTVALLMVDSDVVG